MNNNGKKRSVRFSLVSLLLLFLISAPLISHVYVKWWRTEEFPEALKFPEALLQPVLVATQNLETNTQITEKNTTIKNWPAHLVNSKLKSAAPTVKGRFATQRIPKGSPVFLASTENLNEVFGTRIEPTLTQNVMLLDFPALEGSIGMIVQGDQLLLVDRDDPDIILVGPVRVVCEFDERPQGVAHRVGLAMSDEQARKYLDAKTNGAIDCILFPNPSPGK